MDSDDAITGRRFYGDRLKATLRGGRGKRSQERRDTAPGRQQGERARRLQPLIADAITARVLLALAQQPRRTLLVVELVGAVIVAGTIILPFQPSFAAILAIGVVPLLAYPYWADVGMLHMPRVAGS